MKKFKRCFIGALIIFGSAPTLALPRSLLAPFQQAKSFTQLSALLPEDSVYGLQDQIALGLAPTLEHQCLLSDGSAKCHSKPPQSWPERVQNTCNITPSFPAHFWLEQIKHEGTSPFIPDGSHWKVFRNVKDYGALGDGQTDDTHSIQAAINDGNRDSHPNGVTGSPALVYFPSGTYVVSATLQLWLQTSLVGDPLGMSVIKPVEALGANYVINGNDPITQSTNNFYISIRNLRIDTTGIDPNTNVKAINWAVSQATSLSNVEINMPFGDSQHIGIFMQGRTNSDGSQDYPGSNTMFGDLTITGGNVGIAVNGQQLLLKSINFLGCRTAIEVVGHQLLVLQGMHFKECGTCVDDGNAQATGLYLIDSTATNCGTVLNAKDTPDGAGSVLVENLKNTGGAQNTVVLSGNTTLQGNVDTWAHGNVFIDNSDDPTKNHIQRGIALSKTNRPQPLLDVTGNAFVKKMPQYESYNVSQFVSVKSYGAKGDGHTDDTQAINAALAANANCKITYFPHGVYLVTSTVAVPPGSRLVGEVWSVISGDGAFFGDATNPQPVVQIGQTGSTGVAEITDMVFTINDILPGAVLMEINMAGSNQGDVSLHNSHFRVGGTADSNVNRVCNRSPAQCKAGFLLLHATQSSSAYLEDVWGWTADHSLESGPGGGTYISTGRGFLINSQKATWLMGVAPEHQTLYSLNLVNAQNVYAAMVQVETPYWQPSPPTDQSLRLPEPWDVDTTFWGDPDFAHCDGSDPDCYKAWGMRVSGGSGIIVYGIGTWTFFENFSSDYVNDNPFNAGGGTCADPQQNNRPCQENAYEIASNPTNSYFYGLATKQLKNMVFGSSSKGGNAVLASQSENSAGWGGHIVAYLGFCSGPRTDSHGRV